MHKLTVMSMFSLYENVKQLCQEKGITVSKMCEEIGISKSVMGNLHNGRSASISIRTANKIANYLNVSVDEVLHGRNIEDNRKENLSITHSVLLEIFDRLTPEAQARTIQRLLDEAQRQEDRGEQ